MEFRKKLLRNRGLVERGGRGGGFQIVSAVFLKKSMSSLRLEYFFSGKYSQLL